METIQKQLNEIKGLLLAQNLQHKHFFTLEETAEYLQLSKSCIYKLTSKKEIPFYTPGGKKIYFRKSELNEWVFRNRTTSSVEQENEVEDYISRTNKI